MRAVWDRLRGVVLAEPAVVLAVFAAGVKLAAAFGLHVSADQQALVNAAAAAGLGFVGAVLAHRGGAAALLGAVQAGMALGAGFGLGWSADLQASVMALVGLSLSLVTRSLVVARRPEEGGSGG